MLGRVKVDHKLHESSYLYEESLHTKSYTPDPWYLYFMLKSLSWVVGVKTWILVLSFRPKLNNSGRVEG